MTTWAQRAARPRGRTAENSAEFSVRAARYYPLSIKPPATEVKKDERTRTVKTRNVRRFAYALTLAGLGSFPSMGCFSGPCGSTTGWHFEVGNPGTISTPAILNHQSTLYGASGLVAGPVGGTFTAMQTSRPALPAADLGGTACTLDDICRKLDAISQRLERLPTPAAAPAEQLAPPKPLPRGN